MIVSSMNKALRIAGAGMTGPPGGPLQSQPTSVRNQDLPASPRTTDSFQSDLARRLLVWHLAITAGYVVFALLLVLRPELGAWPLLASDRLGRITALDSAIHYC